MTTYPIYLDFPQTKQDPFQVYNKVSRLNIPEKETTMTSGLLESKTEKRVLYGLEDDPILKAELEAMSDKDLMEAVMALGGTWADKDFSIEEWREAWGNRLNELYKDE